VLRALGDMYGATRVWRHKGVRAAWFDKLYASDRVRRSMQEGAALSALFRQWRRDRQAFARARRACLLYA